MLFKTPDLTAEDLEVLAKIDDLRTNLRYAVAQSPRRWTGSLRRVMFARAIQGSNTIEGYNVTLADAMAMADGEEPLNAAEETRQAIAGYRDAMTYVLQLANDPHFDYSQGLINSLHFMMLKYDMAKGPGLFRPGQIFVHSETSGQIVYEGPPGDEVPGLVEELVADLRESATVSALVRAAMAHLNLAMIHPYRDGNGRMARILQSLVLSQEGILQTEFASVEEYLGRNTQAYYDVLAEVGRGTWQPWNDARLWIRFSLTAHFRQARTLMRRVRQAERLWSVLTDEAARHSLPERAVLALFDASQRFRVRNSQYHENAEISEHAGGRDLKRLVELELLEPRGEKRGRFYVATPALMTLVEPVWELGRSWELEDPYAVVQQRLPLASG
jgi:Fic family protein